MLNILTCAYLALLLLRPQEFVPGLRHVPLLQIVILICAAFWLRTPNKNLQLPQFPLVVWFLASCSISLGMAGWWGGGWLVLQILMPIILLFVVLTGAGRELAHLRRIMVVVIACASIMVLHGHWQLANGVGWTGLPATSGRITYIGIFSDPNDLGQLFTMAIAFCIYISSLASTFLRLTMYATIVWLGYGIYMTDSRGTMLATLVVLAFEGVRRFGRILIGIVGCSGAAVLAATTRFGEINSGEESAMGRVEAWYQGTRMFLSHPIFGVGVGNFTEYNYLTAHNFIVLPMAELGLFGFIPWFGLLWFSGLMLWWLLRPTHHAADPTVTTAEDIRAEHEAARGLTALSLGFAASSFFLSQSYKQVLFIVVGLVVARFIHASSLLANPPKFNVVRGLPRLTLVSCAVIFSMWFMMKMLLR